MKSVGTALAVLLLALAAAYGYFSKREAERIAAPAPGYYDRYAQIRPLAIHEEERDGPPNPDPKGMRRPRQAQ
ncbi:MAG TPA: hypothetical protein VKT78_08735 [Fimbriimonadaceae bacterium]|nr:hypothetical protein [Fimbriimonadaceae bacterium]